MLMPKIRFFLITCPHCGAAYKVKLERIETREPLECYACGDAVDIHAYANLMELVYTYSQAVVKLEGLRISKAENDEHPDVG
jgi:transcription elongation factor Elf1